jgi:hypothetical protein
LFMGVGRIIRVNPSVNPGSFPGVINTRKVFLVVLV